MQPTTVDGVIASLDTIINESIASGSRLGYFAALYKRMTMAIRDGIQSGKFQDNARMERLDVEFATRYLVTRDQWFAGELHGQSWLQAYNATNSSQYTVLQLLLIGINPHIMIDLGVAAARTCPGDQFASLEHDFNTVNAVILSLFPVIDAELDELSPFQNFIDHSFLGYLKDKAINLSIDAGRKSSWDFAKSLAYLDLTAQAVAIGKRDLEALAIGACILKDPMASIARKRESSDVRHNIQVLNAPAATGAAKTP
ncbi:MAG TPA: DUF5995 family protein [Vicinamibacterales bacterium]|nr:DUF5995 family protein [Vicinamibacterales bacterium]